VVSTLLLVGVRRDWIQSITRGRPVPISARCGQLASGLPIIRELGDFALHYDVRRDLSAMRIRDWAMGFIIRACQSSTHLGRQGADLSSLALGCGQLVWHGKMLDAGSISELIHPMTTDRLSMKARQYKWKV